MAAQLIGQEEWQTGELRTQVYLATHDGVGNSLPLMEKSFISFTFGGKAIEDFGLIATFGKDRMEKNAYASFSDFTTSYDTKNGQIYWGSHYEANHLNFSLATDEMSERQLDNFREWFAAGKERELILAEHPNRAILARVENVPALALLPFEKNITVDLGIKKNDQEKVLYETKTTVYRGEITLNFVMDQPHWYSKLNYMPIYIKKKELTETTIDDEDGIVALDDKDMIKILAEDGIPYQSNVFSNMFLGNGTKAVVSEARVGSAETGVSYVGIKIGESEGIEISSNKPGYLFYSGTAPSYPIIQFSMMPKFHINTENHPATYLISKPRNSIYYTYFPNSSITYRESYFKIGNNEFVFTTPSIFTGYNQALFLMLKSEGKTIAEVITEINDKVKEKYSRAYAIACLNALGIDSPITEQNINTLIENYHKFISENYPPIFTFNSETGEATGKFYVKVLKGTETIEKETFTVIEENVGDMVRSNYLVIEGRNYPNSDGSITSENCQVITSNEDLTNVLVIYKNMYL